jgi:hypothetical protein
MTARLRAGRGRATRPTWPTRALPGALASALALLGAAPADAIDLPAAASGQTTARAGAAGTGEERQTRWHGSTFSFDQSATTQTLHLGGDYQSSNPTYEWWFALRPRYYLRETERDTLAVFGWANLYWELTNSDDTTKQRDPVLGPTYLWATYSRIFRKVGDAKTSAALGPRLTFPTDLPARGSGQLIGVGALGELAQTFAIRGKTSKWFPSGRLALVAYYNHPFSRSTSPVGDIHQLRQDIGGRAVESDVLRGAMNVNHALTVFVSGSAEVFPRFDFAASYVWLNSWVYAPPDVQICITTGCVEPTSVSDPTTYRLSTWIVAALGYKATSEVSLSLGYYNLASQLGPDGQRRNPLWSPNARLFLTATANLDAVYQRLRGHRGGDAGDGS